MALHVAAPFLDLFRHVFGSEVAGHHDRLATPLGRFAAENNPAEFRRLGGRGGSRNGLGARRKFEAGEGGEGVLAEMLFVDGIDLSGRLVLHGKSVNGCLWWGNPLVSVKEWAMEEKPVLTRRHFMGMTVGASLLSLSGCKPAPGQKVLEPLKLLFYTDIHTILDRGVPEALAKAAEELNRLGGDICIAGGDCIHRGLQSTPEEAAPKYDLYLTLPKKLNMRVEHVVGNHDLIGKLPSNGGATGIYDPRSMFREKLGIQSTYRSFDVKGYHFILLDSVEFLGDEKYRGFIGPEQMEWLKADVAKVPADQPIILVSHIPFRSTFLQTIDRPEAALPPNLVVVNAPEVLDVFKEKNLVLVLQGHLHVNECIRWNNLTFLMGGAVCAKWWRGPQFGTAEGFDQISMNGAKLDYQYRDYGWHAAPEEYDPKSLK
jgi:Icc protein